MNDGWIEVMWEVLSYEFGVVGSLFGSLVVVRVCVCVEDGMEVEGGRCKVGKWRRRNELRGYGDQRGWIGLEWWGQWSDGWIWFVLGEDWLEDGVVHLSLWVVLRFC